MLNPYLLYFDKKLILGPLPSHQPLHLPPKKGPDIFSKTSTISTIYNHDELFKDSCINKVTISSSQGF